MKCIIATAQDLYMKNKIGNFSFQSIYTPIKDEKDETIAYLNIPLLSAHNELQEEISDFPDYALLF